MAGAVSVTGSAHGAREQDAVARDPRARAYAQARRHSSRVRFYKRAIPIGTVLALAVLAGTLVGSPGRLSGLTFGPVSVSGTKVTMEAPRLTGFRKDAKPYEVTATSATQDVRTPHIVELKEMKARMVMEDGSGAARLEAATGVYDTQKDYLDLNENVHVTTDSGHEALLKSASVDFKARTVVSREPVTVKLTSGVVEADSLEISDGGKVIAFIGRVRTVLDADTPQAPAAQKLVAAPSAADAQPLPTRSAESQPMSLRP